MKEKNTITLEEIEKNKIDENIEAKKKINFKTFVKKEIASFTLVCLVICVLITLVGVVSTLDSIRKIDGCEEIFCGNKSSMLEGFLNRLKMLGVTAIAALVPYFYLPFLGLFGYVYYEAISFAHVINIYGYALGVLRYIVPFVLNVFCISVFTSLSIYLAKIYTARFKLNRKNAMSFTKFRLKVYEMMKNEKKFNELQNKDKERTDKIEKGIKKVEWKNVAIIAGVLVVLQFVSVLIETLVI